MMPAYYDAETVGELLDWHGCIAAVRGAMIALSLRDTSQPLRQVVDMGEGRLFGLMPGTLASEGSFGAKLVSVFGDPARPGRTSHQGVVVAYDAETGRVTCLADAEAVTRIRTAAASAAATDALARADARTLAVLGAGTQAEAHVRALVHVRSFERIILWGRSKDVATELAARLAIELGVPIEVAADVPSAAAGADVICTCTSSRAPILTGAMVRPGTHINLVGSSHLGPVEIDTDLVSRARYIADYRPSVLAQGAELDVARRAGAVTDDHVIGEIGEVFAGSLEGRRDSGEISLYKSLGHVVQDLAATQYVHRKAMDGGYPGS